MRRHYTKPPKLHTYLIKPLIYATMKNQRKQTNYYKVVNVDENEIIILDYIFNYGDGFKGATGTTMELVSEDRYNDVINMDTDDIAEYLIDAGFELPDQYKKGGFIEWAEAFDNNDKLELMFDLSHADKWDDFREQAKLTAVEARIFNCIGGGRCFDKTFNGNRNPKLCKLIRNIES